MAILIHFTFSAEDRETFRDPGKRQWVAFAYDAFWPDQAIQKVLTAYPLKVPVMLVHSL